MFPLLLERRSDFVGTVFYLGDEYDIYVRVPGPAVRKAVSHRHHFQRPYRR
jgi:hypothetical protein